MGKPPKAKLRRGGEKSQLQAKTPKPRKKSSKPFRFLELPYELRLMIYGFCLISKQRLLLFRVTHCYDKDGNAFDFYRYMGVGKMGQARIFLEEPRFEQVTAGLILASRQLHAETLSLLYSLNTFHFNNWREFHFFTENTTFKNYRHIQHLSLPFPFSEYPASSWNARVQIQFLEDLQKHKLKSLNFSIKRNVYMRELENLKPSGGLRGVSVTVTVYFNALRGWGLESGVPEKFRGWNWDLVGEYQTFTSWTWP
ncbi:MAG: hypothetical protein MMC33_010014 [Icmadophila ericetorum]|nr:hypothetical protein [Icmadophila ericetorum]